MTEITIENSTFYDAPLQIDAYPTETFKIVSNQFLGRTELEGITIIPTAQSHGLVRISKFKYDMLVALARDIAELSGLKVNLSNFSVDGLI